MQAKSINTLSSLSNSVREEVIIKMLQLIKESYVFPKIADEIEHYIQRKLNENEYEKIIDPTKFSQIITSDLQEISKDKHLGLKFLQVPMGQSEVDKKKEIEHRKRLLSLFNYGFDKVERLPGNIGYHKTIKFFEPEIAGDVAVASLNYLANTSAIIFDLRDNTGGTSGMVALIISYLFDKRVHLNNFHWRKDNRIEQIWTNSHIQGTSLKDKDVFILTSKRTFSGAEDFSYSLQVLNRATVIGERTKGGAHPGGFQKINDHFAVNIPIGRAVNPTTNDNWEGKGVMPDIEVPEQDALVVAQYIIINKLLDESPDKDIMGANWLSLKEKLELELSDKKINTEELINPQAISLND
ncbi:MAG TPA: S41 family peptidase [Candidatus Sphingobacterium stercoripullorum]|nr:S41 family peptidase [Candidatus Sphingobacterium stercoripullorum]